MVFGYYEHIVAFGFSNVVHFADLSVVCFVCF